MAAGTLVLVGHSGAGPLLGVVGTGLRAALIGSLRPRGLGFTEPLPPAPGWPDAPCGFLRLSAVYDHWAVAAVGRGWPTATLDGDAGHFHPLVDPVAVAAAPLAVLARL
jgi:hypothetical protein